MTFIHATVNSLIVLALFFHVAKIDLGDDLEGMKTRQALFNWVGLSFVLATDIMMTSI